MTPDYSRIWPWIFAVLIPLMIYRRLRRSFGRQPLRPTRMTVRVARSTTVVSSITIVILADAVFSVPSVGRRGRLTVKRFGAFGGNMFLGSGRA